MPREMIERTLFSICNDETLSAFLSVISSPGALAIAPHRVQMGELGAQRLPVAASHTRAVPSPLAVTTRVPSGLNAALLTGA